MIDCGRCCNYYYDQDKDDDGYAIAAPMEWCEKKYTLYPDECKDFKDCWAKG